MIFLFLISYSYSFGVFADITRPNGIVIMLIVIYGLFFVFDYFSYIKDNCLRFKGHYKEYKYLFILSTLYSLFKYFFLSLIFAFF